MSDKDRELEKQLERYLLDEMDPEEEYEFGVKMGFDGYTGNDNHEGER